MRGEPRSDHPLERIRGHLVSLRMPRALEMLDHLVQQIERGQVGTIEAIEALLAEELTIRETRRIKAALQMARLSTIKTLSGFDFAFQPSLDRNRILALANSLISALEIYFPLTLDRLLKERSELDGLKPIVLDSALLDTLFYVLLGKSTSSEKQSEFGCDQVIIVRD